jgi:hypothetical protein
MPVVFESTRKRPGAGQKGPKPLKKFIYKHDPKKIKMLPQQKGQLIAFAQILKEKPGPWDSRELAEYLEDNHKIHTSSPMWRVVNVNVWKLKNVGLVIMLDKD